MDFVADFAQPLPAMVIAEMFGIPPTIASISSAGPMMSSGFSVVPSAMSRRMHVGPTQVP
jgi:hypothetical protein